MFFEKMIMHLGKRLKIARTIKGFTQEDLAEKIGRTRALVSHIEQTGKVKDYTLRLILNALEISEEELENTGSEKGSKYQEQDKEVEVLLEKLEQYQKENKLLKELVESQKHVIKILKKDKK